VRTLISSAISTLLGVSLLGCGHALRPPAAPAATPDNVPGAGAVRVDLYARDDERWALRRGSDDSYVCTLPCSYWVRPASSLVVRLEGTTPSAAAALGGSALDADLVAGGDGTARNDTSFELPASLPANPNEQLTLTVDRTHGLGTTGKIIAAPLAVTFGLMGLAFTTIGVASLATGSKDVTTTASGCTGVKDPNGNASASGCTTSTTHGTAASVASIGIGVGALTVAVLSTIWFFHDREGGLRYEGAVVPASKAPARNAVRIRLSPDGVSGSF
jgi:hypothetical protein